MMDKALLLTDGKAGHENQSKALARALGLDFDMAKIAFASPLAKAASYAFDRCGVLSTSVFADKKGSDVQSVAELASRRGVYRAVIGTGSGCFYAAKVLAGKLGTRCAVVLYPRGYSLSGFDCILAPSFDRPASRPNVVEIPANIVPNDAAYYEERVEAFRRHYAETCGRRLADGVKASSVVIGGPNKSATMTADWMRERLDMIFAEKDGELWVTTSRRTPPEVEAVVDSYPWDYRLIYSRDKFNPIPAFVSLSTRLYVTAESTGMLSEACTCGSAKVVALDNLRPGNHKFRRFVDGLAKGGYVGGSAKIDLSNQFAHAKALLAL